MRQKKICISIATIMIFIFVQVKGKTLVVRGHDSLTKGSTVVYHSAPDTLVVIPGQETTSIQFALKNEKGDLIYYSALPANENSEVEIPTQETLEACVMEISDDNRIVYIETN